MISLTLTDEDIEYDFSAIKRAVGRIRINTLSETIHASLWLWTRKDYYKHWKNVAESILGGARTCALITNLAGPEMVFFASWWPMYREGDDIYVQNISLFLEDIAVVDRMNLDGWQAYVPVRGASVGEDGSRGSEWKIHLNDIETFLVELDKKLD